MDILRRLWTMFRCATISSSLGSRSSESTWDGGGTRADVRTEVWAGVGIEYAGLGAVALEGSPLRSTAHASLSKLPPSSLVKSAFGQS